MKASIILSNPLTIIVGIISTGCTTAQQRSDPTKFNGGSILAMAVSCVVICMSSLFEVKRPK